MVRNAPATHKACHPQFNLAFVTCSRVCLKRFHLVLLKFYRTPSKLEYAVSLALPRQSVADAYS